MEMEARRNGIRAKPLQASEHLWTLTREEAEYVVAEDYGPRTTFEASIPERDGQPGLACRAHLEPPPPPRVGVLCGDVVHSLRSALDHLANTLVVANGGTPMEGPGGTQFPIIVGGGATVKAAPGPAISDAAQRILEEVQPQSATDPLAILQHLSNIDKHRILNVVVVDLQDVHVEVPESLRGGLQEETPPFVHGQLLYSIVGTADDVGESWHTVGYSGKLEFVRDNVVERFARDCLGGELGFPEPVF